MSIELLSRSGWPAELRVLLDKYPREIWTGHANLGEVAQFWLERHQGFRDLGKALATATAPPRSGS